MYNASLKERENTYLSYISRKREEITQARNAELESLNRTYPGVAETLKEANSFSGALFDRTLSDEDFLHIRLGVGKRKALREISYKPKESLTLGDELQILPENISKEFAYLDRAPIVVDLKDAGIVGIVGNESETNIVLKIIIEDICTRQFSKEATLFLVCTQEQAASYDWVKFIPHFQKEAGLVRNIAADEESCEQQFEYLFKTLSFRENCAQRTVFPAIVVFVLNPMGLFTHPVSNYLKTAKELGVYFIFASSVWEELPLYCGNIVKIVRDNHAILINAHNKSDATEFEFEHVSDEQMMRLALKLAPVYCEDVNIEGNLPKSFSLFALLGIHGADDLDFSVRWSKSDITHSMAAPLGIKAGGEVIYLDLHEKHHGPHGLVAGTTGSGKSEILQSYVLSMATLYSPDEVGFVIIDFKGGGMANLLEGLPHLIGTITDIDGAAINRSLMSIRAEIDKRKRLFAETEVNNITDYIRKHKSGDIAASLPLPHLILIIDEFAELKAEHPDFMKEVISTARVGRSLGIHLILATQKPAGVIDDQIWSNSRFKLCLKVQSKSDSNEVLRSPLAAEIKEPGRAYLQVGNNEVFELFQSAYSGGSAKSEEMDHVKPFQLFEVDNCGHRKLIYRLTVSSSHDMNHDDTQLKVIVSAVKQYCDRQGIKKLPPICLPALQEKINFANDAPRGNGMNAVVGVLDVPENQYQGVCSLDISQQNTLILGSAQLGKTNLLQVIIRSIAEQFSPSEVNLYILDFNSLFLKNYAELPHVGGVVCASESEKLKNFFKLINTEIAQRKDLLNSVGVSSFHAYREAGNTALPQIIILVDNFTGLKETYFADDDPFLSICRDGLSLGISVVIANVQTAGFGYRYLSTISNRIALFCNDRDEYINLFGYCRQMPEEIAGRAMIQRNKNFYKLQSYLAFSGEREIDRTRQIQEWIKNLCSKYPGLSAKKIPEIPEQLTVTGIYDMYRDIDCRDCFAIALDYDSIEPIILQFRTQFMLALIGNDAERRACVLGALIDDIQYNIFKRKIEIFFVDSTLRRYKYLADMPYVRKYTVNPDEALTYIEHLEIELNARAEAAEHNGLDTLSECPLELLIINNRISLELLSSSKIHMKIFDSISKNLREYGVMIVFADISNISASTSGNEIAKRIKEEKKAFIFDPLKNIKLIEIPLAASRRMNMPLRKTDAFYFDGDTDNPMRVKIAWHN